LHKAWKKKSVKEDIILKNNIRFWVNVSPDREDDPEVLAAIERLYLKNDPGYVTQALKLAKESRQPLPKWVCNYLLRLEREKYKKAYVDFERYQKVQELRKSGVKWINVYDLAGKALNCGAESVCKSYKLVNKNLHYFHKLPPL